MYCRAVTNLMQQHGFIDGASAINSHFTDSGLFGINVEGPGSHSAELLQVAVEELNRLREPIQDAELNRAKNLLKMNVMMALENSGDRLEEIARNFQTFGALNIHEYIDKIRQHHDETIRLGNLQQQQLFSQINDLSSGNDCDHVFESVDVKSH